MSANDDQTPPLQDTRAQFEPTQWTMILVAARQDLPEARVALERLCNAYWFPLYAFIRSERIDCNQAKDLTQSFFVRLLEDNLIKDVGPEKGRFRSFLLACLRNFMTDQWRLETAKKRGGNVAFVPINEVDAEDKYRPLAVVERTPDAVFDRAWAATVIGKATDKLKQVYVARGKLDWFEGMKGSLNGTLSSKSYPELSAKLGMPVGTLEVNLSRFRKTFGEILRDIIAETVDRSEVQAEIKYLMSAWSGDLTVKS